MHLRPVDVGCLIVGGVIVAGIGLAQGGTVRLESRAGTLWGQMPVSGLWLWLALIGSRLVMTVVADGLDAKVAAATSTILLMLGVNRLAQAAVVLPRAMAAGIPFAPEKDGTSFLANLTAPSSPADRTAPDHPAAVDWSAVGRQAATFLENRHRDR